MIKRLAVMLCLAAGLLAPSTSANAHPLPHHLKGVADAQQVVAVVNDSWSSSYATFTAYEKRPDGTWRGVFGPWPARIGGNGFGAPKREGDRQTPVGSFLLTSTFGTRANPGTGMRWFTATRRNVWVDDPRSPVYNSHRFLPANGRWRSAESLYQPTAYSYAAIIGYNLERRPGAGSAIFLHATTGSSTAGCVSLTQARVVALLRWLKPSARPRIIMGPRSAVMA